MECLRDTVRRTKRFADAEQREAEMKNWKLAAVLAGFGILAPSALLAADNRGPEQPNPEAVAEDARASARQADCLRLTGTRIRPPAGRCASGPGRVYSREELDRTGAIDLSDALRRLDPSLH